MSKSDNMLYCILFQHSSRKTYVVASSAGHAEQLFLDRSNMRPDQISSIEVLGGVVTEGNGNWYEEQNK